MFGALRLLLAILVVAAHCELPQQFNPGVAAVVVFFLLSGFVMTATVRRYYAACEAYGAFLRDRACRIFPQYLLWLTVAVAWVAWAGSTRKMLGVQPVVENIALLPLMFVVYDLQPWISGTVYLSQCWSLSLEWYFYMTLPLLLASRARFYLAFGASFVIAAAAALNVVNPYRHGYHLLPGVLFIFLIGSVIYEECQESGIPRRTLFSLCCVLLLGAVANWNRTLNFEWTREVLLGLLAGIPLVYLLGRGKPDRFDDALGSLSYGVFLNHYVILDPIYHFKLLKAPWAIFGVTVSLSLPLAWLSFRIVELPFVRLRRALRDRRSAPQGGRPEVAEENA